MVLLHNLHRGDTAMTKASEVADNGGESTFRYALGTVALVTGCCLSGLLVAAALCYAMLS